MPEIERFFLDTIDSTNLAAIRLWRSPQIRERAQRLYDRHDRLICVVAAARQTEGRGRAGRSWSSPEGGLWFSLVWPLALEPERYLGVPLVVGLSVLAAIDELCSVRCRLKWPNDLLVDDRKLCGILCETESRAIPALVIGIGINTNNRREQLPEVVGMRAVSLIEIVGEVDNGGLMNACVSHVASNLQLFEEHGFGFFYNPLRASLAWVGEEVRIVESAGQETRGRLVGVDESGRVVLATEQGTLPFISGDLARLGTG